MRAAASSWDSGVLGAGGDRGGGVLHVVSPGTPTRRWRLHSASCNSAVKLIIGVFGVDRQGVTSDAVCLLLLLAMKADPIMKRSLASAALICDLDRKST